MPRGVHADTRVKSTARRKVETFFFRFGPADRETAEEGIWFGSEMSSHCFVSSSASKHALDRLIPVMKGGPGQDLKGHVCATGRRGGQPARMSLRRHGSLASGRGTARLSWKPTCKSKCEMFGPSFFLPSLRESMKWNAMTVEDRTRSRGAVWTRSSVLRPVIGFIRGALLIA